MTNKLCNLFFSKELNFKLGESRSFLLALILCVFFLNTISGQSLKKLQTEIDFYVSYKKYDEALPYLYRYQELSPNKPEILLKIAICLYHTNNVKGSLEKIQLLTDISKNPDPEIFLYRALNLHSLNDFKTAISDYKNFLKGVDESHPEFNFAIGQIKRCSYGMTLGKSSEDVLVENMGNIVNSSGDEFRPVTSKNYDDKIYFSSARPESLGGKRDQNGYANDRLGSYNTDMFSAEFFDGGWNKVEPMNLLMNSPRNDVLLDFNDKGSVMFYFRGFSLNVGNILLDTFAVEDEKEVNLPEFLSPMFPEKGDEGFMIYKDTILIFSSKRVGGYGGSDLYYSILKNNKWTIAENFGPNINSSFDEMTPFLSANGKALWFSSNREEGVGGLDIFKSEFDFVKKEWQVSTNLGLPINSSKDDAYLRFSSDGQIGYFSSNRSEGFGLRDLYQINFRDAISEMKIVEGTPIFHEAIFYPDLFLPGGKYFSYMKNPSNQASTEEVKKVFNLEPIFYEKEEDLLTGSNTKKLVSLISFLKESSTNKIVITGHGVASKNFSFDLIQSLKKAEKLASYLTENGVNSQQIIIRGVASSFPLALNENSGQPYLPGIRANKRVDFQLFSESSSLSFKYSEAPVADIYKLPNGNYLREQTQGLNYRIRFAEQKGILNFPEMENFPDIIIERSLRMENITYTAGLYSTFSTAISLLKDIKASGISNPVVIPYLNGVPINRESANEWISKFPDLKNYILAKP
jgi:hypothetical protein